MPVCIENFYLVFLLGIARCGKFIDTINGYLRTGHELKRKDFIGSIKTNKPDVAYIHRAYLFFAIKL
jgi:hypothetical protein